MSIKSRNANQQTLILLGIGVGLFAVGIFVGFIVLVLL